MSHEIVAGYVLKLKSYFPLKRKMSVTVLAVLWEILGAALHSPNIKLYMGNGPTASCLPHRQFYWLLEYRPLRKLLYFDSLDCSKCLYS
jgi:hypothetical protein